MKNSSESTTMLTIGICTVSTRPENYLLTTLQSLLDHSEHEEQQFFRIVILDCDVSTRDSPYITQVKRRFHRQITSGSISILSTVPEEYPDFNAAWSSVDTPPEWWLWSLKQCYDYGLLYERCYGLGAYYLQLEDDVICASNFYKKIFTRIQSLDDTDWCTIRFSDLGGIGYLLKNEDLPKLAHFFKSFFDELPADWLLDHFLAMRERAGKKFIRQRKSLFDHIGYYSSLPDKIQPGRSLSFHRPFGFVPLRSIKALAQKIKTVFTK